MTACGMLSRKSQILGRIEDVKKTTETLTADDGLIRVYTGVEPDYKPEMEARDLARSTLSKLGSVVGAKPLNFNFRCEANTRDTVPLLTGLDVESIVWQTGVGDGNTLRVTFNSTPDLSAIVAGVFWLTINYSGSSVLDGTYLITAVNDGSDYVDIINRAVTDGSYDVASLSTAVGDIQYPLEMLWALVASGCKVEGVSRIPIGAVTSGPYQRNEIITGSLSSGTGRVLFPVANGDTHIYYMPVSGTLQTTETLTGGTSGATATSSSGPAVRGWRVAPSSGDNCTHEAATIQLENDGYRWKARSAMGNFSFEAQANKMMFMDFAFQGCYVSAGDAAMTTLSRDTEQPPILNNAELFLDSFNPVFRSVNFDSGNTVVLRPNGNAADSSGYESARVTDRGPTLSINLEMDLAANYDFFTKLTNATTIATGFHLGSTLDKQIWFFADYLELSELPKGDEDGIAMLNLSGLCTTPASSAGDDEWEMLFV